MNLRDQIVAEAMTWRHTPYHDHEGLKGFGVDCAHFPLRLCQAFGRAPTDFKVPYYSPQQWLNSPQQAVSIHSRGKFHLRVEDRTMFNIVAQLAKAELRGPWNDKPSANIPIIERDPLPADFVLYKVVASWTHLAFIVHWPEFVLHPVIKLGVIGSHGTNEGFWHRAPRRFFSILGEGE
jgi:hypothetical protein